MNEAEVFDTELRMLEGATIYVDNVPVNKVSLSRINQKDLGYVKYTTLIRFLCLRVDEIKKMIEAEISDDVEPESVDI